MPAVSVDSFHLLIFLVVVGELFDHGIFSRDGIRAEFFSLEFVPVHINLCSNGKEERLLEIQISPDR